MYYVPLEIDIEIAGYLPLKDGQTLGLCVANTKLC